MSFIHIFEQKKSDWTLLVLHGTGGNERSMLPIGEFLFPEAALISPMGKVREGLAARYFRRFGEGLFDLEDLQFRTYELADWIEGLVSDKGLDSSKLIAVGYSNGATVAASLMLLRPNLLKGAIALRPSVPYVPSQLPELQHCQVLLLPGQADQVVSPEQGQELAEILKRCGADVTLKEVASDHSLTQHELEAARSWIQEDVVGHSLDRT